MYVLDYLIYHLRPYGIVGQSQPLPEKLSFADIIGATEVKSNSNDITNNNDNNVKKIDDNNANEDNDVQNDEITNE